MKVYQTDFRSEIYVYGCLMMSLIKIASDLSGKKINKHDVEIIYAQLVADGCMSNTCYIYNHEMVLNYVLSYLGSNIEMVYSGAQYLLNTNKSWGINHGTYIIYQVQAPKFSHFRMMDYDPWKPELKFNSVLSVRYYTIK